MTDTSTSFWKLVVKGLRLIEDLREKSLVEALGGHDGDDWIELMHGHHCCKRDCWHYATKEPSK